MSEHDIRERNVATVSRFYQYERERDLGAWVSLWHAEGRQTFPAIGAEATVAGLDQLREVTRSKFNNRPPYGIRDRVAAFADPNRVFVHLDLDFPGVRSFPIWCIFHFDEKGRITEIEEMVDTGSLPDLGIEQS
ncbi:MAG: nuclear transport factor 2 family protein [Beutenbergiaceae bacterium]